MSKQKQFLYYIVILQVFLMVLAGIPKEAPLKYQLYATDDFRNQFPNDKLNVSNFQTANQSKQSVYHTPDSLPFMYILGWKEANNNRIVYKCGGVLIAPELLLTTAHCLYESNSLPIQVRPENILRSGVDTRPIKISNIRVHPGYQHSSQNDDIAIIELERAAQNIPIKLKLNNDVREDLALYDQTYIKCNDNLLEASITNCSGQPLNVPLEEQNNYEHICLIPDMMHQKCQSSPGLSLLLSAVNGWYTLLGISCINCASGTYTHLSKYIDWMLEIPDWQGKLPYKYVLGWESNSGNDNIDYRCGGVLIGPFSVLIAAHCLYASDKMPITVRQEYNVDSKPINIENITIHPGYKHPSFKDDIALIQLEREVPIQFL